MKASPSRRRSNPVGGRRHFEFVEAYIQQILGNLGRGIECLYPVRPDCSKGQTTLKAYSDGKSAHKAAEKLIAEKSGKGYVEKK